MQLAGILNRIRRESKGGGKKSARSATAEESRVNSTNGNDHSTVEISFSQTDTNPARSEEPRQNIDDATLLPASKLAQLDPESLEQRKAKLLQDLSINNILSSSASPPLSQQDHTNVELATASLSTDSDVYRGLLNHFEKNPDELHQFASKIVLDTLRFMSESTRSRSKTTLEASESIQPISIHQELVGNISDAMDVDQTAQESSNNFVVEVQDSHVPSAVSKAFQIDLIHEFKEEYSIRADQFLKGAKWSPDGIQFVSCCEDNILRVYDCGDATTAFLSGQIPSSLPRLTQSIQEAETIYDFSWYPFSSSQLPGSAVILSSSRDHPLHLWDASNGSLRATYRAYDHNDEVASAFSVAFSPFGSRIYAGYNGMIRTFDISRPGREYQNFTTVYQRGNARRIPKDMQLKGIISSFSTTQDGGLLAAGSYAGNVGLYEGDSLEPVGMLYSAHSHGVSQVLFSLDGNYLFTGGRKDDFIHCWDIRNTMQVVFSMDRPVTNNQRVSFSIDASERYLTSGIQDGKVRIYDLAQNGMITHEFQAHADAVNAAALHPSGPFLLSASGQRHFDEIQSSDDDDDDEIALPAAAKSRDQARDFAVCLWRIESKTTTTEHQTTS